MGQTLVTMVEPQEASDESSVARTHERQASPIYIYNENRKDHKSNPQENIM